jgi:hypothetical protein
MIQLTRSRLGEGGAWKRRKRDIITFSSLIWGVEDETSPNYGQLIHERSAGYWQGVLPSCMQYFWRDVLHPGGQLLAMQALFLICYFDVLLMKLEVQFLPIQKELHSFLGLWIQTGESKNCIWEHNQKALVVKM